MADEKSTNLYSEKEYPVYLDLTEEKQDDVPVIINGETTLIKRGEQVMVSAPVYEVLENMRRMDQAAAKRIQEAQKNSRYK